MIAGARLTALDLSDNAFGPDGVKGIDQLLRSAACHTLRELKLNNCGMGIGGGKVSSEGISHCFSFVELIMKMLRGLYRFLLKH